MLDIKFVRENPEKVKENIRKKFDQISMITDSLKLWIEKMEADGKIDEDKLNAACDELNS